MSKKILRFLSIILCIALMMTISINAFASNNNKNNSRNFKDVPKSHWAYDEIQWMLNNNIINGVGNDLFGPGDTVTRAQFAKMMVLTLNIKLYSPDTPSFKDVGKKAWEYPYVEASKSYLTGFRTSGGDYFKPTLAAVREDMAVALVKAMGYQNETVDESILNQFTDASQISPNLRKFVALSVKHGLVEGFSRSGKKVFDPQGNLSRAAASSLLYKAFRTNEEKITYEEDKVTYDDNGYIKPNVSVSYNNSKMVVSWNKISSANLLGYAIVISKNDSTPQYPDNGFLHFITDKNQTSIIVDNSIQYSGTCDFGKYLVAGENYYISVSAVYSDKIVTGNVERKTYYGPDSFSAYIGPTVYTTIENGNLVARWNKIDKSDLQGYRVVLSKNDSTPSYPENGYLYYITDRDKNYAVINNKDPYNNGDFGQYLTKGEKYYVSITAVYRDRSVAGNAVRFEYAGAENPGYFVAPNINASIENERLVLRWNKIDSPNLLGYRVVASKNDTTPSYPDNGYLYWITDRSKTYAIIDNTTAYTNGDFGKYFIKGENYIFSITAVYNEKNVPGSALSCKYNGAESPEVLPVPTVSAGYENGNLILKWNQINSTDLLEYRVVISKNNPTPVYPTNGYYGVYDKNTTSAAMSYAIDYTNGDFKNLTDGTEYYFSVTAVYTNGRYSAGNTVKKLYLLPPK